MATDKATHQNRRKLPAAVTTTLVALVLVFASVVGINLAEKLGSSTHAVATASPQSFASTTANGVSATPDYRLSNEDFLSSNVNDKISSPISGPRQCRPELNIVTDCIFQ